MIKFILGKDGVLKFVDVRGNWWCVRRSTCRHYYASRDGVKFIRCHINSIATVFGGSIKEVTKLILGEV